VQVLPFQLPRIEFPQIIPQKHHRGRLSKYTPEKKPHSYDAALRQKAVQLYVDGMNLRRIGRHLGVHHQSVANWAKAHAENLPAAPVPDQVENAEMDEIFTFISDKKTEST